MQETILVAGLPGSGKTRLGKRLAEEKGYLLLDDISTLSDDANTFLQQFHTATGLVITDPMFCYGKVRDQATEVIRKVFPTATQTWIFFENDPKQCLLNATRRSEHKPVSLFIDDVSKEYSPPDNATLIPVYRHAPASPLA